jgi:UDP-GlcNAc:undecaprenyl-phosphate GlcNAc-1-phosphate transferase
MVALIPIFDTSLVTVLRIMSGRSAAQGGRDHSSHRLVAIGLSERGAVAVLWTLAALGGLLALAIRGLQNGWASAAAAVFVLAMIIFAVYLAHVRVYDDVEDPALKAGRATPFVVTFMYRRRVAEVLLDVCLAAIAYYTAWRLRFEGPQYNAYFTRFLESLPLVVGIQTLSLYAVGGYRGVWRYFGLMDGVTFGKGVFIGTLSNMAVILFVYRFEQYSRGVFVIYAALMMLMLCGSRASFRLISEFVHRRKRGGQRVVIYGAGDLAASVVRDLMSREEGGYRLLGFIDDDPGMARARMQGYPVLGGFSSLISLIANGAVDAVVITRLIDVERLKQLEQLCTDHSVSLSRLHFRLDPLVAVS